MHVDDTIGGGNETFNRVMTASQMPNGDIVFDMEQFKHELEQTEVSKADKTKPERNRNTKEHT